LIDLGLGELWTEHFRCLTSVEVYDEVEQADANEKATWIEDPDRLEVRSLNDTDQDHASEVQKAHPALSYPDCTVIAFATRTKLIVLSGDGPMRKKATGLGIRLHGMLYVLRRLVEIEALLPADAIAACLKWQELNPRTPTKKCDEYCMRWGEM